MATTGTNNHDTLSGGTGNDLLTGYLGNDTYRYALGGGTDTVRDTGGSDTLDFLDPRGLYSGLDIYRSGTNLVFDFFSAGKLIVEKQYDGTASRIERLGGDEDWGPFTFQSGLTGTAAADFIVGTAAAESISGAAGGDLIWGGAGNDTIQGGDGENEIEGGAGNDVITGGVHDDEFHGGAGSDKLSGGAGHDGVYYEDQSAGIFVNLSGQTQAWDNRLIAANRVFETATQTTDTLSSIEDINGTNFADYFMLGRSDSNTSLYLGKGNDTIDGGSPGGSNYWASMGYYDDPAGVIVNLGRAALTVTLGTTTYNVARGTAKDGWGGRDTLMLYDENLSLSGSEFADYYRGRDDTDSDTIYEWFGGGRGNDTIDGGTGSSDTAAYSVDDDEAPYGAIVNLSAAALSVSGLTVSAGTARDNWRHTDTLRNIENIDGSRLADYIVGSSANNGYLNGAAGNDTIKGGAGMDFLQGGAGNDSLMGDAGMDHLTGGIGRDVLTGGADRDYFHVHALNESGTTSSTRDLIKDFTRNSATVNGDIIDLSAIDAGAAQAGDQAFDFIGASAFSTTDATGQLRYEYSSANGYGILYGSTDADTAAEFSVRFTGVSALAGPDFML
ncbi:MAG: calcium-binding protein [Thauera sp.]